MNLPLTAKHLMILSGLLSLTIGGSTFAGTPEETFYHAYFLEHEQGDFAGAAKLYKEAAGARGADAKLKSKAKRALASCREELASADLASLMPPDAIVYAELTNPASQVGQLLKTIGLLGDKNGQGATTDLAQRFAISPTLLNELLGLRGAAVALTGFDPETRMPSGVAILNPGHLEVIRGALETILPAGARAVEPIKGHATYFIDEAGLYVCMTLRLIIASFDQAEIVAVLNRIDGKEKKSFANNPALAEVLNQRPESLVFVCANAKKLVPMIMQMPGAASNLGPAQAFLDLDSLRWVAARVGFDGRQISTQFAVGLDKGHHNLAYNLVRTPPIQSDLLKSIPKGAAAFLAAAMNDGSFVPPQSQPQSNGAAPAITGLDIGREIFANVRDFTVFALPPSPDGRSHPSPIPNVAAVIRVHDSRRSQALWTQLLGIASLATGAPTMEGETQKIANLETKAYNFHDAVTVYVATLNDKLLVATTRYAMEQAAAAEKGGASVLDDEGFSAALANFGAHTSKAFVVNPSRCLQIARQFMSEGERQKIAPFVAMLNETVASVITNESEEKFSISTSVVGLPNVGPFINQMIQHERQAGIAHHKLRNAQHNKQWDEALQLVNTMLDEHGSSNLYRTKFEILAVGKKDRAAALQLAEELIDKTGGNAGALNRFAWALLTDDDYENKYDELALTVAEKACQRSGYQSWAILDTLALAKFNTGALDQAIELQEKAVNMQGGGNGQLKETLARYQAAKSKI